MSDTIGFERDNQPNNDVDKFVALYDEIVKCRRTIDAACNEPQNASAQREKWASYQEIRAVLSTLDVTCPLYERDDYGETCNEDVLHSLFLQKISIFARIADLESAREHYDSTDWKTIVGKLLFGPPINTPEIDERKVVSSLLAAIVAMLRKLDQIDYADPKEFAVAVQHLAMRTTGLSREERYKLDEWTRILRQLCS